MNNNNQKKNMVVILALNKDIKYCLRKFTWQVMTVPVVLSYFSYYNQKLEAEIWG